jgi:hypothetical protein
MLKVWEDIGSLARLAPTPHNTQPFRIRPRGERAELLLLTERLLPREDHERLELWLELAAGVTLAATPELEAAMLDELCRINQDFREALRMMPEGRRPRLKLFPFGASPISGQDIRIKRRYIV